MDNVNDQVKTITTDLGLVLQATEALEELLATKATSQSAVAEHLAVIRKGLSECHASATDLVTSIDSGEPVSTVDPGTVDPGVNV